jgi:spore germination protein GerM
MLRRSLRALALAMALVAALAGCGVTANDSPQTIGLENLPPDLLDPNPGSSTTAPDPGDTVPVPVYLLVRDNEATRLSAVEREVSDPTIPGQRLTALLTPPSEAELADGLITSIPTDTVLLQTAFDEDSGELVVDLSDELFAIEGAELANAFAQMVFTALEVDGVSQVRFLVDGEAIQPLNAEGRSVDGAVNRTDYLALAPR